jgi:hypothetical protein
MPSDHIPSLKTYEAARERGLVEAKRKKIAAQIEEIRSLNKNALRRRWQELFKKPVPNALTKDLLARMIAYRIQEQAFGGLDRKTKKILESYANGKPAASQRYLKSGTVLIREYQGVRHTVTIVDGNYIWNDKKYASLSIIAKEITGTSWNGPRFFGLRESNEDETSHAQPRNASERSAAR